MSDRATALKQGLDAARSGHLPVSELAGLFRSHAQQWDDLPPRFAQVLESLLMQLESASLFTEESCSFSQQDLLDSLATWLDHAETKLRAD